MTSSEFEHPHHPVANFIRKGEYVDAMIAAADEVAGILEEHCGPFAMSAVIPTHIAHGGAPSDRIDRFTKDGISIAREMRTANPTIDYIFRLVRHIGERVDSACHDGTTTSMYLFSLLVKQVFKMRAEQKPTGKQLRIYSEETYKLIIHLLERLPNVTLKAEDLLPIVTDHVGYSSITRENVVLALAYHEALLAAKGDVVLADAIARVVSTLPEEIQGFYEIVQTDRETDEPYIVKCRDHHIGISSNCNTRYYNTLLNTELQHDDAMLFVSESDLIEGSPVLYFLITLMLNDKTVAEKFSESRLSGMIEGNPDYLPETYGLTEEHQITKPLIILSPTLMSSTLFCEIRAIWERTYPDKPIVDVTVQVNSIVKKTLSDAIISMAGKFPISRTIFTEAFSSIIDGVRVNHGGNYLKLSNLFPTDDSAFHPFYRDPDAFPFYTETRKTVLTNLETSDLHVRKFTDTDMKHLAGLYRSMTCQKIYDLWVGGTTYETVERRDVVQDAYGAALSAVADGVVFGGHFKLLRMIEDYRDEQTSPMAQTVCDWFTDAICEVVGTIYQDEVWTEEQLSINAGLLTFSTPARIGDEYRTIHYSMKNPDTIGHFIKPHMIKDMPDEERFALLREDSGAILVQPIVGFKEQLRRFRAILPSLIMSTTFVNNN